MTPAKSQLWHENNQISDISPLSSLKNIKVLNLGKNQIIDVSVLANLTLLTRLNLSENQIADIKPLTENRGFRYYTEIELE